jgi:hypothetical protein
MLHYRVHKSTSIDIALRQHHILFFWDLFQYLQLGPLSVLLLYVHRRTGCEERSVRQFQLDTKCTLFRILQSRDIKKTESRVDWYKGNHSAVFFSKFQSLDTRQYARVKWGKSGYSDPAFKLVWEVKHDTSIIDFRSWIILPIEIVSANSTLPN